ncbi:hypothetical protein MNBD_PLANCTO03-1679 [hydrothermal vent metagenome]|uniref:Uncharacterized protein n=1 Tax=hydrothermal vent metagenome TaxID=652676 RepID=A0A3B1E402_9ZZZZ
MLPDGNMDSSEQQLRTLSLLVGSLLLGMVSFVVMAVVMGPSGAGAIGGSGGSGGTGGGGGNAPGSQQLPMVFWIAVGAVTAGCFGAFLAFGKVAQDQAKAKWEAREDDEAGRAAVVQVLFVSTIIRAAFAEMPGVLAGATILIGGGLYPLAVAGVSVLLLASLLPVRSRLARLEEAATGMRWVGTHRDGV